MTKTEVFNKITNLMMELCVLTEEKETKEDKNARKIAIQALYNAKEYILRGESYDQFTMDCEPQIKRNSR